MPDLRQLLPNALVIAGLMLGGCAGEVGGPIEEEDPSVVVDANEPDPWSEVAGTEGESEPGRGALSCSQQSGIANGNYTRLSYTSTAKLARSAGIKCGYSLVKAVAVAAAESGRYQYAYLRNYSCSIDRGLWQINSSYWKSYSSYDLSTNAHGMYVISNHGSTWSPWVAYTKGLWKNYLGSACSAVKAVCGYSGC
jgi:hypothetical protein